MIFKTESGSMYTLRNNRLQRISEIPLYDMRIDNFNSEMITDENGDEISFHKPPTIGEQFVYDHSKWHMCISTVVIEIMEE